MKSPEQILEKKYADTCTRLKDMDKWCIKEAMKEYAKEVLDEVVPQMYPGIANWASKLESFKYQIDEQ